VPELRTRTASELHDRQIELDAILATTPADLRSLIQKTHTMDRLPFDAIDERLKDLVAGRTPTTTAMDPEQLAARR
jgi:hypothetical protein